MKSAGKVRAVWWPELVAGNPDTPQLRQEGRAPVIDRGQQHDGGKPSQDRDEKAEPELHGPTPCIHAETIQAKQQSTEQEGKEQAQ